MSNVDQPSPQAVRRLMRDWKRLSDAPNESFTACPKAALDNNTTDNKTQKSSVLEWTGVMLGAADTIFESDTFEIELTFSNLYPFKPPVVRFVTPIFHPNVYGDGRICLDILADQWSPTFDVTTVLLSVQSLLADPNPNSPANATAAALYVDDRREYERRVKEQIDRNNEKKGADGLIDQLSQTLTQTNEDNSGERKEHQ